MMERGGARKKQQGNKKRFLQGDMKTIEKKKLVWWEIEREIDREIWEIEIEKKEELNEWHEYTNRW